MMSLPDLQKPPRGTARAARVARRTQEEQRERRAKTQARKRDGYRCRWPKCDCRQRRDRIEVAHLRSKSLGGANEATNLISVCLSVHQGSHSLHSQDKRIMPLTDAGANGPVIFYARNTDGDWYLVARERSVGLLETE